MEDYSQGKIYKIISSECDLVYYGSTVDPLNVRLNIHKGTYNMYLKGNHHYVTSFGIIEKGNYEIVLVENYPCNSKKELRLREGEYIKNNQCVNHNVAGRTPEEYYEDNHERILNQRKEYREKNREIIRHKLKEYNEENREKINQRQRDYNKLNREKINQKIICNICGSEISKRYLSRHQKTKKCLEHNIINI
jgi:ATP-dependent helicase YprA (DUF1998 family)